MALLPPGTASGDGTLIHNELVGRDAANAHPITAITGLADTLAGHDTAIAATQSLRYIYVFNNTTTQDVILPTPLNTPSLVLVLVRTSDGAMIEPEVTYILGPPPMRYIERIRLGFSPPLSGEHMVGVVR